MTSRGKKETDQLLKDWKRFTLNVNALLNEGEKK